MHRNPRVRRRKLPLWKAKAWKIMQSWIQFGVFCRLAKTRITWISYIINIWTASIVSKVACPTYQALNNMLWKREEDQVGNEETTLEDLNRRSWGDMLRESVPEARSSDQEGSITKRFPTCLTDDELWWWCRLKAVSAFNVSWATELTSKLLWRRPE
jgi:hypothetical protein